MSVDKKDCNAQTQLLGYVSAKIVSPTAPSRTDVLWFRPIGTDTYDVLYWNGSVWISIIGGALGLYSPNLDDSVAMPEAVGGYPAGTLVGELRDSLFSAMWDQLLFPVVPPTYTSPTALLTGSNPKIIKVGDAINAALSAAFGQNDAGSIISYSLGKNGSPISSNQSYTDVGAVLSSPGSIRYEGLFTYGEGPVKNDSNGNPNASGQIPAGSIATNPVDYEWIYPYFFGSDADGSAIDVDLGTEILSEVTGNIQVQFPSDGAQFYWLAVPASAPVYTRYENGTLQQGDIGVSPSDLWAAPILINVDSGNFTSVQYRLYVTNYITQLSNLITFKVS